MDFTLSRQHRQIVLFLIEMEIMEVINKLQSQSVRKGISLHPNRQVQPGSPALAQIFSVIFVHYRRFLEAWSKRGSFGVINWVTEKRQISKVRFLQVLLAKTSLLPRTAGKGSSTCVPVVIMEDSRLIARQSI